VGWETRMYLTRPDTYVSVYFSGKAWLASVSEQVKLVCDEGLGPNVEATAGVPDDHLVPNFHHCKKALPVTEELCLKRQHCQLQCMELMELTKISKLMYGRNLYPW
jgi:hypothetical protein